MRYNKTFERSILATVPNIVYVYEPKVTESPSGRQTCIPGVHACKSHYLVNVEDSNTRPEGFVFRASCSGSRDQF